MANWRKYDPNSNRMFREDMGACNEGCKCQTRWDVWIEAGEVVDRSMESPNPCHLRNLSKGLERGDVVEKDGTYWCKWDLEEPAPLIDWATFEPTAENEPYKPEPLDIVEVEGVKYYREPCDAVQFADEQMVSEVESRKLPDGQYDVTVEFACFSSYSYEYGVEEGDSDSVIEIVPLKEEL